MPYRLGYVPIYNIWWAEQDLNLQVVSDQRFSRPLPHQPGHTAYIWCVPRDSNPYSQKRTAPSRQRVYQIPPGTHIVFRYRRQTVNYSATSYRASCFTHYCIGRDVTQLNVLRNVHRRISLGYSIPTVYVLFMLLHQADVTLRFEC